MTKQKKIRFLTTNCACWKGKGDAKTLNALPDEKLTALVEAAQERAAAGQLVSAVRNRLGEDAKTLTVNQLVEALEDAEMGVELDEETDLTENCGEEMESPESEEMEDTETEETESPVPPKAKKKGPPMPPTGNTATEPRRMTMEEWESVAPVEVLERDRRAKAVVNAERERLVSRLVSNSSAKTPEQKTALKRFLSSKTLDDLNAMTLLSANARAERSSADREQPITFGDFGGLANSYDEPTVNGVAEDGAIIEDEDDADGFGVPTMNVNWAEEVKLFSGRRVSA